MSTTRQDVATPFHTHQHGHRGFHTSRSSQLTLTEFNPRARGYMQGEIKPCCCLLFRVTPFDFGTLDTSLGVGNVPGFVD